MGSELFYDYTTKAYEALQEQQLFPKVTEGFKLDTKFLFEVTPERYRKTLALELLGAMLELVEEYR